LTRDERGRFIAGSAHRYALKYDDGRVEYVTATTPSEAVANRSGTMLPHTITDRTQLKLWAEGRAERSGIHLLYEGMNW